MVLVLSFFLFLKNKIFIYFTAQSRTRLKRLSSSSSINAPGELAEQAFRQLDICRREFYEAKFLHLPIF